VHHLVPRSGSGARSSSCIVGNGQLEFASVIVAALEGASVTALPTGVEVVPMRFTLKALRPAWPGKGNLVARACASSRSRARCRYGSCLAHHAVGSVPPSITYSAPVIQAARGEARKVIRSAISFGFAGRPIGMPPIAFMSPCFAPS